MGAIILVCWMVDWIDFLLLYCLSIEMRPRCISQQLMPCRSRSCACREFRATQWTLLNYAKCFWRPGSGFNIAYIYVAFKLYNKSPVGDWCPLIQWRINKTAVILLTIFSNEFLCNSLSFHSPKFVPKDSNENKSSLVKVMDRRQAITWSISDPVNWDMCS